MRLFEFGDCAWVPDWYHVNLRKYLILFYKLFGYYRLWVPAATAFLERTGRDTYIELGSGGGEALQLLVAELPAESVAGRRFLMTDIRPVAEFVEAVNRAPGSPFAYEPEPVDAAAIPARLGYPRLFINSFHHFAPDAAQRILAASLRDGQPVLVLEYVRHAPLSYLSMLAGPLVVWLTLPFAVAPRQLPLMLVVTYLVPIFPLMLFWDGLVSCWRAYGRASIQAIVKGMGDSVELSYSVRRGLLFPAGVTAIAVFPGDSPNGRD